MIYVKMVIIRLSYFFTKISQEVINEDELKDIQEFITRTMVHLDMCFPPEFFDITEHRMIHMVDQIRALGPLYLHEMWTYECFMLTRAWTRAHHTAIIKQRGVRLTIRVLDHLYDKIPPPPSTWRPVRQGHSVSKYLAVRRTTSPSPTPATTTRSHDKFLPQTRLPIHTSSFQHRLGQVFTQKSSLGRGPPQAWQTLCTCPLP
jgi:hypothetical protein